MKNLELKTKVAFVMNTAEDILKDIIPKLLSNNPLIKLEFGEVSFDDLDEFFNRMKKTIESDTIEEIPDLTDINPIILEEYKDMAFFVKELKNPTMDLDSFLLAEASLSY